MAVILDASASLCWAFPDEDHPIATAAWDRLGAEAGHVPSLWWYELRNALVTSERRGRLTEAETAAFLRALSVLPITIDRTANEAAVLALARRHRLTVYDASYLELAQRLRGSLATLDEALATAARIEGVDLIAG